MEELEWIPDNCKILLSPNSIPVKEIQNSFVEIGKLSGKKIEQLRFNTRTWVKSRSWEKCSHAYIAVYRGLLNDKYSG
jgi:lysophospholipid acyltransferase (LPLAT)-like uncharacterized protein